jgi:hypothetical protein
MTAREPPFPVPAAARTAPRNVVRQILASFLHAGKAAQFHNKAKMPKQFARRIFPILLSSQCNTNIHHANGMLFLLPSISHLAPACLVV